MTKVNSLAPAVDARSLRRVYGDRVAVNDLSFTVARGELFGFLGPNGAGKTTTISMLTTLLAPTAGTALVAGLDIRDDQPAVRRMVGLVFQESTLDQMLTARENLLFHAVLHGIPKRIASRRADELLSVVDLYDRRSDRIELFSGGMKRRLEVVRALLHRPAVLFLDEPTTGLDPHSRATVWSQIEQALRADGTTLFLTTHYLEEAERCDRIAIIDRGEIVALGAPQELKAAVGADRVTISTADDVLAAGEIQRRLGLRAAAGAGGVEIRVPDGEAMVAELVRVLPLGIRGVSVRQPSLDDVFLHFTGHPIQPAQASRRPGAVRR